MKKIPKHLLDKQIEATRLYWTVGGEAYLNTMLLTSQKIEKATGICFCAVWDGVSSILKPSGFNPGADNEVIYSVLNVLGWEVVDEENL